jgi:hypothetical protein
MPFPLDDGKYSMAWINWINNVAFLLPTFDANIIAISTQRHGSCAKLFPDAFRKHGWILPLE